MQYAEGLTDRQAADQVRARMDWKYLLGLELDDPGFDASVLSLFRACLVVHGLEQTTLERLRGMGLLQAGGRQRTGSTHVLAAVRTLNRMEFVGETLRAALEALAVVAPRWLSDVVTAEWAERYGPRVDDYRFQGVRRSVNSGPSRLDGTDSSCWRRPILLRLRTGCARSKRSGPASLLGPAEPP
ncbi:transposase [Streptomyces sp. NPDC048002]|uniref:transposase n=1 Tax=Streptomyces sp. NPDC048002 TaxID=3154344 RepID=UPI0033C56AB9